MKFRSIFFMVGLVTILFFNISCSFKLASLDPDYYKPHPRERPTISEITFLQAQYYLAFLHEQYAFLEHDIGKLDPTEKRCSETIKKALNTLASSSERSIDENEFSVVIGRIDNSGCEKSVFNEKQRKLYPSVYNFTQRYFNDLDLEKNRNNRGNDFKDGKYTVFWMPMLLPNRVAREELISWPNVMLKRYCEINGGQYYQHTGNFILPPSTTITQDLLWEKAKLTKSFAYKICVSNGVQIWALKIRPVGRSVFRGEVIAVDIVISTAFENLNGKPYSVNHIK